MRLPVNSAMLTRRNHSSDNGFFGVSKETVVRNLMLRCYEPVGCSFNVPFLGSSKEPQVAFVFEFEGEIRWVHLPKYLWLKYVFEYHGRYPCDVVKRMHGHE